MLHHTVEGRNPEGDDPSRRVVLVHGFTQTGRSWDEVAAALTGVELARVDLPGHGGSAQVRLKFAETAAAIGDAGARAVYVGYSMGGRLCLRLAVDRPDLVSALVLVGASPGLVDAGERERRRRSDFRLATDLVECGTEDFLHHWLAQPMFETLEPRAAELAARRTNPPEGLASALRELGTGAQEPLWHRLGELGMPVVLVAGERDAKFVDLARRMAAQMGANARTVFVADAGHAVHLDRPGACAELVQDVVDDVTRSRRST